ncbi:uncharacterized protein KY384_004036 [Bacidia gigantensis]|uniref:uncharacterized protein n=1 Tax=Bacidia gigantensis TaxID=2732470 RepID=UPI001D03FD6C|nr:uncharacterized protein KY384_004036 [Bacidia gigantensis]KAG8530681.1 hypothetical protein KY384_004036 [Bacidia gigantensis]
MSQSRDAIPSVTAMKRFSNSSVDPLHRLDFKYSRLESPREQVEEEVSQMSWEDQVSLYHAVKEPRTKHMASNCNEGILTTPVTGEEAISLKCEAYLRQMERLNDQGFDIRGAEDLAKFYNQGLSNGHLGDIFVLVADTRRAHFKIVRLVLQKVQEKRAAFKRETALDAPFYAWCIANDELRAEKAKTAKLMQRIHELDNQYVPQHRVVADANSLKARIREQENQHEINLRTLRAATQQLAAMNAKHEQSNGHLNEISGIVAGGGL